MNGTRRKTRVGKVVSDKMQKTVVVAVEWRQRHRLYRKSIRRISNFSAHDEQSLCRVGDQVRIVETRPISKTKRWRVLEILERHEVPEIQPGELEVPPEAVASTVAGVAVKETTAAGQAVEEEAVPTAEVTEVAEEEAPTAEVTEVAEEEAAMAEVTEAVEEEAPTAEVAEVVEEEAVPTADVAEVVEEEAVPEAETAEDEKVDSQEHEEESRG